MKSILKGSIALTFFSLAIILFQFSCKKEAQAQNNSTLTKEQILVEKSWKVDRLHHVIGCAYSNYINGGQNTTGINYDILRFKFDANGTGTHINQLGINYTFTWQFAADKRSITITLTSPTTSSYTWEMVEIAGNYLHASTNLTISNNSNNIETFRLIQIP
jgi:hypothetical protein